jgi:23S rRNA pseudouridine1911/1915/1917 synthase
MVEGIRIIHDDESIVVIDKPVGVAVHPSMGWTGPTVVGHLRAAGYRIATSGAPERQGIVQRLDVGTSGVMVICKGERAYSVLKNAFRHRTVDKTYHALVQGHPDPLEGTIDAPIGRAPKSDWKFAVRDDGKHSVTHYETLEAHRFASLVEVHLETGRTHQIRVHMAALKHPCVGDLTYGADPTLARRLGLERQWLHAVRLGFEHPDTGEYVEYSSDYPADLAAALAVIREEH